MGKYINEYEIKVVDENGKVHETTFSEKLPFLHVTEGDPEQEGHHGLAEIWGWGETIEQCDQMLLQVLNQLDHLEVPHENWVTESYEDTEFLLDKEDWHPGANYYFHVSVMMPGFDW